MARRSYVSRLMPQEQRSDGASAGLHTLRDPAANRYEVYGEIGSGGMAIVEYARLIGPHEFTRACAIKRLHPHFAKDPSFVDMFIDEARLSARLHHANIIPTLDVIARPSELALVMEYVHGESLWKLLQLSNAKGEHVPVPIATWLLASVAHGLHAAHEARGEDGESLGVVHRDVSPHNILVGADGVPRVLDFGIAKAVHRLRVTPSGEFKGKLSYVAPEQLESKPVDRRTDVYGASVVLWETLTGFPLFHGASESAVISRVLHDSVAPPSEHAPDIPAELDAVVLRGLKRDPELRFASALEFAIALERVGTASQSQASAWVMELAGEHLARRLDTLRQMQTRHLELASTSRSLTGAVEGTRRISDDSPVEAGPRETTGVRQRARVLWPWGVLAVLCLAAAAAALSNFRPDASAAKGSTIQEPVQTDTSAIIQAPPQPFSVSESASPSSSEGTTETLPPPAAAPESQPVGRSDSRPPKPRPRQEASPKPPSVPPRKCPPFVYRDGIRYQNTQCVNDRARP